MRGFLKRLLGGTVLKRAPHSQIPTPMARELQLNMKILQRLVQRACRASSGNRPGTDELSAHPWHQSLMLTVNYVEFRGPTERVKAPLSLPSPARGEGLVVPLP